MGQTLVLAGQTITPAVLNRIYGIADTTSHAVNNTTYANLSSSYSIPAGDALVGTAYRLTTYGNGTWGSTQQALTVACNLAGTNVGTTPAIASTAFSASGVFDFEFEIKIVCVSTGTTGTWIASIRGGANQTTNPVLPGTAADNSAGIYGCTHSAVTQDTTVANSFAVQAKWASATGSPTLSCQATIFEKVN